MRDASPVPDPPATGREVGAAIVVGVFMAMVSHHTDHAAPTRASTETTRAYASNEALGNAMAASGYGWTGPETTCLDELWQRESGWSQSADTRASGLDPPGAAVYAYGIPQSRPADKMAASGADWQTNPATQIRWGLGYIRATYSAPCEAWANEQANGWY